MGNYFIYFKVFQHPWSLYYQIWAIWTIPTKYNVILDMLVGKDHDAGKDWRQEEEGTTEDEMVEWYHQLNGHEFRQISGGGKGQGSLVCCVVHEVAESDTTEQLNNNRQGFKDLWWPKFLLVWIIQGFGKEIWERTRKLLMVKSKRFQLNATAHSFFWTSEPA